MIEPIPPVLAAIGTPNSNAFDIPDLFPSAFNRGMIEATTMAVAAVFDISMEAIIVVVINPISRFLGFVPEILNVSLNNDSSSLVFVITVENWHEQMTPLESRFTICQYFPMMVDFISA